MRPSLLAPCASSLLLVAAGGAPAPPPEPRPAFGVTADLVVLDLVAWDRDGRFVADLRPEEIEIYEAGKLQKLEFLRREAVAPPDVGAEAPAPAPPVTASVPDLGPARTPPSVLVVVVDLTTVQAELLARTRKAILDMVRRDLPAGTRLMLATLERGLRVRQPLTDDPALFAAAVEALPLIGTVKDDSIEVFAGDLADMCSQTGGLQVAINHTRMWVENVRVGLTDSLEGLAALARLLAALPGRKHVVYYSTGYPMQPAGLATTVLEETCAAGGGPGDRSAMEIRSSIGVHRPVEVPRLLHVLVDEANRDQVSVYAVDARGLMTDVASASVGRAAGLAKRGGLQRIMQRVVREPQEYLGSLSDGTGGTATLNSNDLARGMRAATRDAHGYYLLAYAPAGKRQEGRFYPVEVKVRRAGVEVRHRGGFEWLSEATRLERAVAGALRFPDLYAGDGLAVEAALDGGRLKVATILPTAALAFRHQGQEYTNAIDLFALLRDDGGKAVGGRYLFAKGVTLKMPEDRYAAFRTRDNVEIPTDVEVPKPGHYTIAVVARHSGGRLSASVTSIDVP